MGINNVLIFVVVGIICIAIILCIFMMLVNKSSKKNMEQFQQTSQQMFSTIQNMHKEQAKQNAPKKCPYCGAMNESGKLKCGSCDASLG